MTFRGAPDDLGVLLHPVLCLRCSPPPTPRLSDFSPPLTARRPLSRGLHQHAFLPQPGPCAGPRPRARRGGGPDRGPREAGSRALCWIMNINHPEPGNAPRTEMEMGCPTAGHSRVRTRCGSWRAFCADHTCTALSGCLLRFTFWAPPSPHPRPSSVSGLQARQEISADSKVWLWPLDTCPLLGGMKEQHQRR